MKGPGHGSQYDVRRVWECPVCQKRVKTSGSVVNLRCEACARNKTGDTAWMRLLEQRRKARPAYPAEVLLRKVDKEKEALEPGQSVPTPQNAFELETDPSDQ
jgi:hypothetical protein